VWHCWDFSAPPAVICPPHSYLAPGELCPPCPPRYVPARRWIEPDQRTVPNQCSNIRSFPGPSLSAHAKFERPRHPKQRVLARRDFYFRTARIVIVTHRSANQKENAGSLGSPGLPDLLFWRQMSQIWLFLETVGVKKLFVFSQYLAFLEAVGTRYQNGVFAF